jgi:hypothetical protein
MLAELPEKFLPQIPKQKITGHKTFINKELKHRIKRPIILIKKNYKNPGLIID